MGQRGYTQYGEKHRKQAVIARKQAVTNFGDDQNRQNQQNRRPDNGRCNVDNYCRGHS